MKAKPISERERRELAEAKAEEKRLSQAAKKAEKEARALEHAKMIYEGMWQQFAEDWKKGKSLAYSNLLCNLTKWASDLVPVYMTAKEHMQLIGEATEYAKSDGRVSHEDPRELMSQWLREEIDLSRIPLEKVVA